MQEAREEAAQIANLGPLGVRFGSTCNVYSSQAALSQGLFVPNLGLSRDFRVDPSCFVGIRSERVYRRLQRPYMVWMCCMSVEQMFSLIRALAGSLESVGVPVLEPNAIDDTHSLHRYSPKGFEPCAEGLGSRWERYWDNPPKEIVMTAEQHQQLLQSVAGGVAARAGSM